MWANVEISTFLHRMYIKFRTVMLNFHMCLYKKDNHTVYDYEGLGTRRKLSVCMTRTLRSMQF